jgi:hypothetical protein
MFRTLFYLLIRNTFMLQESKISDRMKPDKQVKRAHSTVGDM